jgi:exosome complex component RRP41
MSASVNAVTLALIDAGVAMVDFVVGCTAGYLEKTCLVDPNFVEESGNGPNIPVAILAKSGKVSLLQMDSKLPLDVFEEVLAAAVEGCKHIHDVLRNDVREHTVRLLEARGPMPS